MARKAASETPPTKGLAAGGLVNAKLEVCFVTSWVNEMSDLDLDLVLLLGVAIFSAAYGLYLLRAVRAAYEMDDGPLDKTAVELVRHQAISMMPKGKIMSRKVLK